MCDKRGFASYRLAKEVINFLKGKRGKHKIPKRAYMCKACGEFHLTSRKSEKKYRFKNNRVLMLS
jgi:hypothetical protein